MESGSKLLPMLNRIFLVAGLLFSVVFMSYGAELKPSAKIVSKDTAFCETGIGILQIKFSGEPPFGIIYTINYEDIGPYKYSLISASKAIPMAEMSLDTIYSINIPDRGTSCVVTLDQVFDNTENMSSIPGPETAWNPATQGTFYVSGIMNVAIDHIPTPFAGVDAQVCNYQDTLNASPIDNPKNTLQWSSSPSVQFDDVFSKTPIVKVPIEGDYKFWLKEISGVCNATDSVLYKFLGNAKAQIAAADKEICVVDTIPFTVTSTGSYPLFLRLSNGIEPPSQEFKINSAIHVDSIKVLSSRTFEIFTLKDKNNCFTPSEERIGEFKSIDLLPHPIAGDNQTVCGETINLNGLTDKGVGHWEGDGVFSDANSASTTFTANGFGAFDIYWIVNNKGCIENDSMLIGDFYKKPYSDAGNKQRLFLESETYLNGNLPEYGEGTWFTTQNSVNIVAENDSKTQVKELPLGVTTFRWVVENGLCPADTSYTSVEVKEFTYSTAFTPNGDGINDKFEIFGLIQQPVANNELKVFDANGRLLYSQKNYTNTWDGKDNSGNDLPSGAYYYLFSGDGIEPVQNYLIIKRK